MHIYIEEQQNHAKTIKEYHLMMKGQDRIKSIFSFEYYNDDSDEEEIISYEIMLTQLFKRLNRFPIYLSFGFHELTDLEKEDLMSTVKHKQLPYTEILITKRERYMTVEVNQPTDLLQILAKSISLASNNGYYLIAFTDLLDYVVGSNRARGGISMLYIDLEEHTNHAKVIKERYLDIDQPGAIKSIYSMGCIPNDEKRDYQRDSNDVLKHFLTRLNRFPLFVTFGGGFTNEEVEPFFQKENLLYTKIQPDKSSPYYSLQVNDASELGRLLDETYWYAAVNDFFSYRLRISCRLSREWSRDGFSKKNVSFPSFVRRKRCRSSRWSMISWAIICFRMKLVLILKTRSKRFFRKETASATMIDIRTGDIREDIMFGISTSLKEMPKETEMLWYPSKVQRFLREDFASTSNRCDLLINLDPYADKLFGASEVNKLIGMCELLIQRYCKPKEAWMINQADYYSSEPWMIHQSDKPIMELHQFLELLKRMCIASVHQNALICFWGD